jgi:HPt (histidine-containing phosphotransfer) domain-containing protein
MTRPLVSGLLTDAPDFFDLVAAFVDKLPGLIQDLQTLHNEQDWDTMRDRIHDLKGLGGGYGYPQITEVATSIEAGLLDRQHDRIVDQLEQLGQLLSRIQLGLESHSG